MLPFRLTLLLLAVALLPAAAQAPPASPLPRLLAERRVLTQRYAAARAQRHSLFGNKPSKADLQQVVTSLQGIVDKDEQIVAVLNQMAQAAQTKATTLQTKATTLQATGRDDRNLTAERLADLRNEQLNVRERERRAVARQRALEDDLDEARQGRRWRDWLIAGLGAACAGLLLWRRQRP